MLSNVKTGHLGRNSPFSIIINYSLRSVFKPGSYKKGSHDAVDFAVKLPGKLANDDDVWLPIDAKFPLDLYQQLLDAQEKGDKDNVELAKKQLENRVKLEAKTIFEKYIDPPHTTDFAVLYFPTEGLYAEVLCLTGIQDLLQTKFRILIAGPTTLLLCLIVCKWAFVLLLSKNEAVKFGHYWYC